mmetsp:Transcript_16272/g.50948  ORF Transcript_16272/g.50948 Transcript_16272/m.50948 type:complete len:389 (+) Transcript_16272:350-1516(+)
MTACLGAGCTVCPAKARRSSPLPPEGLGPLRHCRMVKPTNTLPRNLKERLVLAVVPAFVRLQRRVHASHDYVWASCTLATACAAWRTVAHLAPVPFSVSAGSRGGRATAVEAAGRVKLGRRHLKAQSRWLVQSGARARGRVAVLCATVPSTCVTLFKVVEPTVAAHWHTVCVALVAKRNLVASLALALGRAPDTTVTLFGQITHSVSAQGSSTCWQPRNSIERHDSRRHIVHVVKCSIALVPLAVVGLPCVRIQTNSRDVHHLNHQVKGPQEELLASSERAVLAVSCPTVPSRVQRTWGRINDRRTVRVSFVEQPMVASDHNAASGGCLEDVASVVPGKNVNERAKGNQHVQVRVVNVEGHSSGEQRRRIRPSSVHVKGGQCDGGSVR